jgi:hypothetical protein
MGRSGYPITHKFFNSTASRGNADVHISYKIKKENEMKKLIFTTLLCNALVFILASTSMAWSLAYAHDENGNGNYGNIQTLIDAVTNGHQVRFSIIYPGLTVDALMNAQQLWVKDNVVYGQSPSIVGASFIGNNLAFNAPFYNAIFIMSTTGNVNITRWNIGEHVSAGDTSTKLGLKWYVD